MDLKAQIQAAEKSRLHPVEVEEWGVTVYLRPLSSAEWDAHCSMVRKEYGGNIEHMPNWRARMICPVLCDENGNRLFDNPDELGQLSTTALKTLFDELAEANGMTAESHEDIEKNYEETPADSSPSSSELT